VSKTYPGPACGVPVLKGVHFAVQEGEFVMVTGPSGSGKSTLLNLAGLLDEPTGGEVWFGGQAASRMPESGRAALRAARIGMIFQKFCLLPHRTALENVLFRFRYMPPAGRDMRRAADEALERVGLASVRDRPARLLSQGEMQRVAIARAVVSPPALLLADEPTGNLDGASAQIVMATLAELHRGGLTVLMVTHNPVLLVFATRRVVCSEGRIQ
jgi:putative ABC transport system ATP-binding protein